MIVRTTINLLRKTEDEVIPISPFERKFQRITGIISISILILTLATAAIYLAIGWQKMQLEKTKERLQAAIAAQKSKEIVYHALKERIAFVQGILEDQKSWEKRIDLVTEISDPPILQEFSGNIAKEITVKLHVDTFEEVAGLTGILMNIFTRKDVTNPRIVNYSFNDEDGISVTLGFLPVF